MMCLVVLPQNDFMVSGMSELISNWFHPTSRNNHHYVCRKEEHKQPQLLRKMHMYGFCRLEKYVHA